MFYTIYKITNKLNGKYYIGKHQTKDLNDGYMGSGKLITRAIKKHGIDNFTKEILFVFDNEDEMNAKEAELVVVSEETYNLCAGGKGGWSYVNREGLGHTFTQDDLEKAIENSRKSPKRKEVNLNNKQRFIDDPIYREKMLLNLSKRKGGSKGRVWTEETKQKMSKIKSGSNNPQYGSMWITNGLENRMIKDIKFMPDGWYRGRSKL